MKAVFALFSILWALLLLPSCSSEEEGSPTIRLALAPRDHNAALYLAALHPEYFQQNGDLYLREITPKKEYELAEGGKTAARIILDESGDEIQAIKKICEGQADISLGSFTEIAKEIDSGQKIKLIAPIASGETGLVVAKESPRNDWKSFAAAARFAKTPIRIGVEASGSAPQMAIENAFAAEGIPLAIGMGGPSSKATLINLHSTKNLIPALRTGLVDGIAAKQPTLAEAELMGAGKVIAKIKDFEGIEDKSLFPCCAACADSEFAKKNKKALEKLMTLFMRASRYANENQPLAASSASKWLGTSETAEKIAMPTLTYWEGFGKSWEDSAYECLKSMGEKGILRGQLKRAFDKRKYRGLLLDEDIAKKISN